VAAVAASGLATLTLPRGSQADTFSNVYYDAATDELVVSMIYGGTNAQHGFTLQWGQCRQANGGKQRQLDAEVLDNQWQDQALKSYQKTVRFSLAGIPCRPAQVTLRTAPRYITSVMIPATGGGAR
jgi:hypothetical protein